MKIAYRAWMPGNNTDDEFRLYSLVNDYEWEGPVVGSQRPRKIEDVDIEVHNSMEIDPGLGFYSAKNYNRLISEVYDSGLGGVLRGAVQIYGTVRVHEYGYRSQYCQVLALSNQIGCEFIVNRRDIYDAEVCDGDASFIYGSAFFCTEHLNVLKSGVYYYNSKEEYYLADFLQKVSRFYQCEILSDNEIREIGKNGYW